MKTSILGLSLLFSLTALAEPTPITEDVAIKNKVFSQKIYEALEAKIPAVTRAQHERSVSKIEIPGLISCQRVMVITMGTGKIKKTFSCSLLKGGWRSMGMEMYGSGFKQKLSKQLFDSLTLKVKKEEGMSFKTIELDVADGDGGTERNLLSCVRPGKEAAEMGFRDTCEVMNGL